MSGKRAAAARYKTDQEELEDVVTEQADEILNYEEARVAHRAEDTFIIVMKNGDKVEVTGHDIGISTSESEAAKLPIFQIFTYVELPLNKRTKRVVNKGNEYDGTKVKVYIETLEGEGTYVKVVKALLWPGEWLYVTRELGEENLD